MAVAVLKPKGVNGTDTNSAPIEPIASLTRRRSRSKSQSQPLLSGRYLRYLVVLLPLFYFSGLLMCVAPFSIFLGLTSPPAPGAVYRSHELLNKLWRDIEADNYSEIEVFVTF